MKLIKVLPYFIAIFFLTRAVFSDSFTYDEPLHVQSGIEWLKNGTSVTDPFNPPLSKLPVVFTTNIHKLRFFSIAYTLGLMSLIFYWSKKFYGVKTAILASFLLVMEPTILAYGHLFTTEILATLVYFLIFMNPILWPLVILVKVTLIPMLLPYLNPNKIAGIVALILFFIFRDTIIHAFSFVFNPKFASTHTFMLFENLSNSGWWYYPLLVLPIKLSPILLFSLIIGLKDKRSYKLIVPIFFILLTVIVGRYNTGIRHLLPLFPFLVIIGAIGLSKINVKILVFILFFNIVYIFKINDYIAYFNPLIGSDIGGRIAVESNLDIGQSVFRAQTEVDFSKIDSFVFNVYGGSEMPIDISNKNILVSRTLWYTKNYYKDPRFLNRKTRLIADGTLILVE